MIESISSMEHLATFRETFSEMRAKGGRQGLEYYKFFQISNIVVLEALQVSLQYDIS